MLIIGFTILGFISIKMISNIKKSESETLAKVIGEYSITALDFNYPERGDEILEKLKNDPNVIACHLFDNEGKHFSYYYKNNPNYIPKDFTIETIEREYFKKNTYHVIRKIIYNDQHYGWIYLIIDSGIYQITFTILVIFSGLFITLFLLSILMTNRFQRVLSEPILELANITEEISRSGRYNYRLHKKYNDEIGALYDEFNNMLKAIEKREFEKSIAQQKVKENEQWIQTIINNLNDAVFVHDIKTGQIIYSNHTALKLYGYQQNEIFKLTVGDISVDNEKFNQNNALLKLKKCIIEGPQVFEWQAKNKAGKVFWVEVNMRKAFLNNLDRIIVVVKEIDERKKQQEELYSLQKYLRNIIDSMPSIIIGTDDNTIITQWNQQAEQFTNLLSKDIVGKKIDDIVTNFPHDLAENIEKSIKNQAIIALEKEEIWNRNEKYFFDITIYPVTSSGKNGAVIRIDNITEKIQMEEMMIQSEKMLSIGGLAAGMAHEINNPLAGMMQNATVIVNRLTRPTLKNEKIAKECGTSMESIADFMEKRHIIKHLQLINESGKRASLIISNMLSFARKSESKYQYSDLSEVLNISVELAKSDYDLKKKYDFRKIGLVKEYEEGLDHCYCDPSKIEQVFLNLLKNGAHAMSKVPDRDPKFILRIYKNDNYFVIEIEDNGPGIEEKTKKRIFEPFFTTKIVGEGTGLGLSVSYFIVTDNHNGIMQVESIVGKGTKFIIKLPEVNIA